MKKVTRIAIVVGIFLLILFIAGGGLAILKSLWVGLTKIIPTFWVLLMYAFLFISGFWIGKGK